jgi:release factor glutamine methyltransferase
MPDTLHDHITAARQALLDAGLQPETAAIDADVLARHALGWDRARVLARAREPAPPGFASAYAPLVARRRTREPVALIVGRREFWGLEFEVTPATLIPRPETELIVEEALRRLPAGAPGTILDIGTGTGCLAIAIAHERPRVHAIATDVSREALLVARRNAAALGVAGRVHFVRTDLAAGIRGPFAVVVSNPPYVPDDAPISADVRYEPAGAVFAGPEGLDVLRRLCGTIPAVLAPGGAFIVEFGFAQEDGVRAAADAAGWTVDAVLHDLQGIPRTVVLRR